MRFMHLRAPRVTPAAWAAALIVVLFGLSVALGSGVHGGGNIGIAGLPIGLLGLVIARRQPGNRVAWLLLVFGVAITFYGDAATYSVFDYHAHGGTLPLGPAAAVIASELWSGIFLLLPLVIMLFPDGRLPPRWRLVMRAYLAVCALIVVILLASGASQVSGTPIVVTDKGQLVSNPGATGLAAAPLLILLVAVPVFWASFVARQVLSWRQATGERRAQLKWLMAGAAVTVVGLAGTFALAQFSGGLVSVATNVLLAIGIFSLPICICFAILKYHLYDIDRLISRTLSYTLLTGLLGSVYAGIVTLATRVLPFTSAVAVATSTLIVAALFNPLRRRVQRMVDRRFNRARYDADQTVAAFAAGLKAAVDLDSVRDDLAGTVHQALEPAHVSVWLIGAAGEARSGPSARGG
jgi:hypothetical protein